VYSKYYDLLYKDKDYKAETLYISNLLKDYAPNAINILELGSGTGIHGLMLKSYGYDVFGIERSEEMVYEARKKGFECAICDIRNYRSNKKYDTVMALFHVISYLTCNNDLLTVFKNAFEALNDDGIFLFDVWYTPAVYFQKPEVKLRKIDDNDCEIYRITNPLMDSKSNIVNVRFDIFVKNKKTNVLSEFSELHPMRHFSYNEILLFANISGFDVINCEEFLSKKPISDNTWGVCFVLRKKSIL
jgi:SAM-dependent methyltransferase